MAAASFQCPYRGSLSINAAAIRHHANRRPAIRTSSRTEPVSLTPSRPSIRQGGTPAVIYSERQPHTFLLDSTSHPRTETGERPATCTHTLTSVFAISDAKSAIDRVNTNQPIYLSHSDSIINSLLKGFSITHRFATSDNSVWLSAAQWRLTFTPPTSSSCRCLGDEAMSCSTSPFRRQNGGTIAASVQATVCLPAHPTTSHATRLLYLLSERHYQEQPNRQA